MKFKILEAFIWLFALSVLALSVGIMTGYLKLY